MIRFNNDYNHGAHPAVLAALQKTNGESYGGYGVDPWCDQAEEVIRKLCGREDLHVHFFPGATQANFVICAAALRPIDSVICADTGHISAHECASVEHIGHKIVTIPNHGGKISAEEIERTASAYYEGGEPEYWTVPKLVYLSFASEYGTLYTKAELKAISDVCRKYHMLLFVDGARMGYGLGAAENDLTLRDFASLCDVFYIGGTKCGAMFGEAVVVGNPELEQKFKSYMKQNGAVLAKGWTLGLQFCALLRDGLYFDITRRADEYAVKIQEAFREAGIPLYVESPTNQQFVLLNEKQKQQLAEKFIFEEEGKTDAEHSIVRFCTSWSTTKEEVEALIHEIRFL